mmetsp:Transcript_11393/g.42788  ORF Transcript_11393/g.42788 Transcript_11393/m.42788 type:complete len:741 (-) Transcript_11393:2362-4584(-)
MHCSGVFLARRQHVCAALYINPERHFFSVQHEAATHTIMSRTKPVFNAALKETLRNHLLINPFPTHAEKLKLCSQYSIPSVQALNQELSDTRRLLKQRMEKRQKGAMDRRQLFDELRTFLHDQNIASHKSISHAQWRILVQRYSLSKSTLIRAIYYLLQTRVKASPQTVQYIVNYCKERGIFIDKDNPPTHNGRFSKRSEVNLSFVCEMLMDHVENERKASPEHTSIPLTQIPSLSKYQLKRIITYHCLDPPKRYVTQKDMSRLNQCLLENNFQMPNRDQIKVLARELRMTTMQVRRSLHRLMHPPGTITQQKREFIVKYVQEHDVQDNASHHIQFLMRYLSLNQNQLRFLMMEIIDPRGVITRKKKKLIRHFHRTYGTEKAIESIDDIKSETGLSRVQIYNELRRLRMKRGAITEQKKKDIREYILQLDGVLTPEDFQHLSQTYGLLTSQLKLIHSSVVDPHKECTIEKKEALKEWSDTNPHVKYLTSEHVKQIQEQIDLGNRQIRQLFNRMKVEKVNQPVRREVESFLMKHAPHRITDEQLTELKYKSGLLSAQIHSILPNFYMKANRTLLTTERRHCVQKWLEQHGNRSISDDEWKELCDKTQMTTHQLQQVVWHLKDSLSAGDISEEKKEMVRLWMKEHDMRQPRGSDLSHLSDLVGLSRIQIGHIAKRVLDPPREITDHSRSVVFEWMKDHDFNRPSLREELDMLQESAQVSRQQLHDMIRTIRRRRGKEKRRKY